MSQIKVSFGHALFQGSLKARSPISSSSWGLWDFWVSGGCNFKLCTSLPPWGLSEFSCLPVGTPVQPRSKKTGS